MLLIFKPLKHNLYVYIFSIECNIFYYFEFRTIFMILNFHLEHFSKI